MKKLFNDYKLPVLIAVLQWIFTMLIGLDRLAFTYSPETDMSTVMGIKFLYLICLIIAWSFGFTVFRRCRAGDEDYRRGVFVFSVYMSILFVLILIVWPGTWSWDDIGVLIESAVFYEHTPWQHILSGIAHMLFMQLIPCAGGVILVQNIIIAICASYCVVTMERVFSLYWTRSKWLDTIVKLLPFLTLPLLSYQFSGYRMGLYVYLELAMLCMLISLVQEKKPWSWAKTLFFASLLAIVSTWRTESFLFIPVAALCLILNVKCLTLKKSFAAILFSLVFFLTINSAQTKALGDDDYTLVSTLRTSVELARAADPVEDAQSLALLEKAIFLDVVESYPTLDGEELYWFFNLVKYNYSREDYSEYMKGFIQLSLKYPEVVFRERTVLFLRSIGTFGSELMSTNAEGAISLFDPSYSNPRALAFREAKLPLNAPFFPELRTQLCILLGQKNADGTDMWSHRLTWNALIPILTLGVCFLALLFKKKWMLALVALPVVGKIALIYLTEPSSFLMYHLSPFICGNVVLVYWLLHLAVRGHTTEDKAKVQMDKEQKSH